MVIGRWLELSLMLMTVARKIGEVRVGLLQDTFCWMCFENRLKKWVPQLGPALGVMADKPRSPLCEKRETICHDLYSTNSV